MRRKKITTNLDKVLLKGQGVGLAILFGSKITGINHPGSDVDIGIVFVNSGKRKESPIEVYGILQEEFTKKSKSDRIDIVYLEESPLSLQYKAVRDGIVLYESSKSFFADYKEKVLKNYFDFKFVEDMFNQAVIETV